MFATPKSTKIKYPGIVVRRARRTQSSVSLIRQVSAAMEEGGASDEDVAAFEHAALALSTVDAVAALAATYVSYIDA